MTTARCKSAKSCEFAERALFLDCEPFYKGLCMYDEDIDIGIDIAAIKQLQGPARWERLKELQRKLLAMAAARPLPWTEEEGPPPSMFCRCGSSACLIRLGREENSLRGTELREFFL